MAVFPRICKQCGKKFLCRGRDIERGWGTYCSHSCCASAGAVSPIRQFLNKISEPNEHGCILWTGTLHRGYGLIQHKVKGKKTVIVMAHRFIIELIHGPLHPSQRVLHSCDICYPKSDPTSRRCVNPNHLFIGTQAENMADMRAKGRASRGEQCHLSVLTDEQVVTIRKHYATGLVSMSGLARRYKVTIGNISAIINGRTWKHLL